MIRGKSKVMIAGYLVLVCSVLMCGSTLAYFIHHDMALNRFVVGSQVSEINELWTPPAEMKKGSEYTKRVTVKNTGTAECYVRVFAEMMDDSAARSVTADWNTADWTEKQTDGYYYYRKVLAPGESTAPLLTKLTSSADLQDFGMIVYEESVQAHGATDPKSAFEY